jgi:hypothetical protein
MFTENDFPELSSAIIFQDDTLIEETLLQLKKDLLLCGIEWEWSAQDFVSIISEFHALIEHWISTHNTQFYNLFYRIDIPQQKWQYAIQMENGTQELTKLIVKRELEKVLWRRKFKT